MKDAVRAMLGNFVSTSSGYRGLTCDNPKVVYKAPSTAERHQRYIRFWGFALLSYGSVVFMVWFVWKLVMKLKLSADQSMEANASAETRDSREADAVASHGTMVMRGYDLRFKSSVIEHKWSLEHERAVLKRGARVLCYIALCGMLYFALREWATPPCVRDKMESSTKHILRLTQALTCLVALILAFGMAHSDTVSAASYWKLLVFFAMWLPAMNCPPYQFSSDRFQWSCQSEIRQRSQSNAAVAQQLEYSDFSLLGTSSTMVQMTWLLVLPWLVPRTWMMYFAFLWIGVVYVGWGKLYMSVFPKPKLRFGDLREPFDITVRTLFLLVVWMVSTGKKWHLEKSERNRFVASLKEFRSTKKMYTVLAVMVPEYVILPMLQGQVIANLYPCVSVLFSEIQNFDVHASSKTPKQLLDFLNVIFDKFDAINADRGVRKIETWGHEYVACVGADPAHGKEGEKEGHRVLLEKLLHAGAAMMTFQEAHDVKFRMGVHTGPILAGVIGDKLPRYRLFGDTMNTAARHMQKSQAGELQFGEETVRELKGSRFGHKYRGEVLMKGKGSVRAYILDLSTIEGLSVSSIASSRCRDLRITRTGLITALNEEHQGSGISAMESCVEYLPTKDVSDNGDEDNEHSKALKHIINTIIAKGDHTRRHFVLSERNGFTPEMETLWYDQYHRDTFCYKLRRRMGRICLMLIFLSSAEVFYLWYFYNYLNFGAPLPQSLLSLYWTSRSLSISVQLVWWYVTASCSWIIERPFLSQMSTLLVTCVSAVSLGVSYIALSGMHTFAKAEEIAQCIDRPFELQMVSYPQCFILLYVLTVYILVRSHQFLFFPSLLWPLVASIFMICDAQLQNSTLLPFRGKVMFVIQALGNSMMCHVGEQERRAQFKAKQAKSNTMERTQDILQTLMPPQVLRQIRKLGSTELPSHFYRHATLVQSDLSGFTKLVSEKTPTEVVELVEDLFGRFDRASAKRGIYKIETVGDAYIAGMAELPLTAENSPADVVMFGLDMVQETKAWSRIINATVRCRVGVHSGECIGGVVGYDMQRYHIFGEMMQYIEILESCGIEGRVHVSRACKAEVEQQLEEGSHNEQTIHIDGFEERTDALQTSKGDEHSFAEVGGQTFLVRFSETMGLPTLSDV